jgi:hypothetical protein
MAGPVLSSISAHKCDGSQGEFDIRLEERGVFGVPGDSGLLPSPPSYLLPSHPSPLPAHQVLRQKCEERPAPHLSQGFTRLVVSYLLVSLINTSSRSLGPSRNMSPMETMLSLKTNYNDCSFYLISYSAAIGLGLYGNDDFHNGVETFVASLRNIHAYFDFVKNQVWFVLGYYISSH